MDIITEDEKRGNGMSGCIGAYRERGKGEMSRRLGNRDERAIRERDKDVSLGSDGRRTRTRTHLVPFTLFLSSIHCRTHVGSW